MNRRVYRSPSLIVAAVLLPVLSVGLVALRPELLAAIIRQPSLLAVLIVPLLFSGLISCAALQLRVVVDDGYITVHDLGRTERVAIYEVAAVEIPSTATRAVAGYTYATLVLFDGRRIRMRGFRSGFVTGSRAAERFAHDLGLPFQADTAFWRA